jgi:hypothetical protein
MPALPWTPTDPRPQAPTEPGPQAPTEPGPQAPTGGEVVVLASRLELRRFRAVAGFLAAAMRVRAQVRRTPGALGVSLVAEPGHRTFWTLSAWTDRAAIDTFVGTAPHRDIMRRFHDAMEGADFTTWTVDAGELPRGRSNARELWREARARLTTARTGGAR